MANELRIRANFQAGVIDDNPLLIGATTLNSTLLATLPVIGSTNHLVLILDPLASAGAPEIIYVTAHTASATSATIARGKESSTARAHNQNVSWIHSTIASDYPVSKTYTVPTSTTVTSSSTLASFATPISVGVDVVSGQVVDVEAVIEASCSTDNLVYWGLRRNPSTVLTKSIFYTAGSGIRPQSASPRWTDTSPGSGALVYELMGASSGGTLTAYPSDGSTTVAFGTPASCGGTQIKVTPRWA